MKFIKQRWYWVNVPTTNDLFKIESAGRTCYQSHQNISADIDECGDFIRSLIRRGHESVLEHASASVRFITNRGVTHELVRHRLAAYSQESTRYVRYDGAMEFIRPVWWDSADQPQRFDFIIAMARAEDFYKRLLAKGWSPQQAREVLPNAIKTEIVVTANLREWRHILKLRTANAAHPQMRELMLDLLENGFRKILPVIVEDINPAG